MICRLFAKYPTYQNLFEAFKDTPKEELKNKAEFLKHASSVANALNSAIANLNDPDKLVPMLTRIGQSHLKRNVTAVHFSVSTANEMIIQ